MEKTVYDQMLAEAKRGNVDCKYTVGKAIYEGTAIFTDPERGTRFLYGYSFR